MRPEEIRDRLQALSGVAFEWHEGPGDPYAVVAPEHYRQVAHLACGDMHLGLNFLRSLCGVDRPDQGVIEIVVHLWSYRYRHQLVLKTRVDRNQARLPSLGDLWPAAIWHERETFDLFGVRFEGNPDLRRILLPEGWEGHPLRKDYREPPTQFGIPTRRPGYDAEEKVTPAPVCTTPACGETT